MTVEQQQIATCRMTIEVDGQVIQLFVRDEIINAHRLGQISDAELLEAALDEAPDFLEVKESPVN